MPRFIPVPVRQSILTRSQKGQPVSIIAQALGLCPRTVRHLLQHWRSQVPGSLGPNYVRGGRPPHGGPSPLVQEALALRAEHPTWGADCAARAPPSTAPAGDRPLGTDAATLARPDLSKARVTRSAAASGNPPACHGSPCPLANGCGRSSGAALGEANVVVTPDR